MSDPIVKLKPLAPVAYALLRISAGFMFSLHGMQKMFGILGGHSPAMFSQVWIGGVIELLGGLAIVLGVKTRWAAFLCSGQMAVAYFQFHWKFQMNEAVFPVVNKGELAALYCFVFLLIATMGPGKWAIEKS